MYSIYKYLLSLLSPKRFRRACFPSGEVFFTPHLEKAVANLRPHLLQGCLRDPSPQFLPMYYCTGRSTKLGLPTFRSTRGTNRVETYHRHLGLIWGGHRAAPQLASSITVVHNHRRNHRMAGTACFDLSFFFVVVVCLNPVFFVVLSGLCFLYFWVAFTHKTNVL